jgi:hypothetical protein
MKEQNTYVEYTRSELDTILDETDWDRVDELTDKDIDAQPDRMRTIRQQKKASGRMQLSLSQKTLRATLPVQVIRNRNCRS